MKSDTIEELERFLQLQVLAVGKVSPEIAITLSKLANLYATNGNYNKAEVLHNRALEILLNTSGTHQSDVEDSRRSLNRVRELREKSENQGTGKSSKRGSTSRAGSHNGQSKDKSTNSRTERPLSVDHIKEMELEIALLKQMVGGDHQAVAVSLTRLADLYRKEKMYDQMEPLLLEALRIHELIYGSEHPNVSSQLKNLAQLYLLQEKYSQAEPFLRRSITIRAKSLGPSHPKVLDMETQYVKLLRKTQRFTEADHLDEKIKNARKQENDPAWTAKILPMEHSL